MWPYRHLIFRPYSDSPIFFSNSQFNCIEYSTSIQTQETGGCVLWRVIFFKIRLHFILKYKVTEIKIIISRY